LFSLFNWNHKNVLRTGWDGADDVDADESVSSSFLFFGFLPLGFGPGFSSFFTKGATSSEKSSLSISCFANC
jgi:hypothetical protein